MERVARERAAEGFDDEAVKQLEQEHKAMVEEQRGSSKLRVIEKGQLNLIEGERQGRYEMSELNPGYEYPAVFCRIPIVNGFHRSTHAKKLDKDMALPFNTGWGEGRKFGPPLNVYDEDTLLALGALREKQLSGMGNRMPIKVLNPFDPKAATKVDVLYTTIGEIQDYLQQSRGGRGYKKRLESVKRLAAVTLEFTRISDPNVESVIKARSFNTKIIDLVTEELSTDSVLFIQFPPAMVVWLSEQYVFIDMDIRRQLKGDYAKLIHKWLSSQPRFNIGAEKLKDIIEYEGSMGKFMAVLRDVMSQLEALDWLEYKITGTGRKTPWILRGNRVKKDS